MRAVAFALGVTLLVAVAVPAQGCPPMTRRQVDPVVAIQERLEEGDLREVATSAQWIGRQRSRPAEQRARALAVAAAARFRLGEIRTAERMMKRAFAVDEVAARTVPMVPDALLAAAGVSIEEILSGSST